MKIPNCPKCNSEYTYEDEGVFICPECTHEWGENENEGSSEKIYKDANGNILVDGDTVTVIKDLKYGSGTIKRGTKVKNIRLIDGDHDIDCKIPGIGAMQLKTSVVKKG